MSVDFLNDYEIGNVNFNPMMESLDKTFKGKANITISNHNNDDAPAIKAGVVFECSGSLYIVTSDDEEPTGYSGISDSSFFYLVFDSSTKTFYYTEDLPTYDDGRQGWYRSTENNKYFYRMYKDSTGLLYQKKRKLVEQNNIYNADTLQAGTIEAQNAEVSEQVMTGLMKWKKYYKASNISGIALYNILTSWVPDEDDYLACHGQVYKSGGAQLGGTITGLLASSGGNTISILFVTTNLTLSSFPISNSLVQTFEEIELMSNFDKINIPGA